jgi:hypothetical protein
MVEVEGDVWSRGLVGDNGREAGLLAILEAGEMRSQGFDKMLLMPLSRRDERIVQLRLR